MIRQLLAKQSVFITLAIIIVSTVITIMLIHALYSYHVIKSQIVRDMQENAAQSAIALKENISNLIEAYAINEYEKLVATEMEHRNILAVVVRDYNMGRIMGQEAYISGKIRDDRGMIIDIDPMDSQQNTRLKQCYYSRDFPITNQTGEALGSISIYITDDMIKKELGLIITSTVINTLILSFFLILALFLTIQRFILKPLSDMATVIGDHDADGIPNRPIPQHGPKEILALARTMGTMIDTVKTSRSDLKELNSQLQERIEAGVRENTRLEKEKLQQEKILIEQSKMAAMGEMISAIAHQWRQPLSSLALDIQDLKDAREFDELDDEYLETMIERSMHTIHYMSQTIDDFRSFFLPDKKREPFSIYETIEATKHLLGKQFEAHSIVIESAGEDFWINGFKNEFQQVLINLLNNAKDAINKKREEHGAFQGRVMIHYGDNQIIVADNGGGVPESILDRIFEPYFSTKFSAQGTGIGLYMTKTIIERNMHGSIRAFNRNGEAVFEITLPSDQNS